MSKEKADVFAEVLLKQDDSSGVGNIVAATEHKGRFKWNINVTEKEALTLVMKQFTRRELGRLKTIILDPVSEPHLSWLTKKKIYDFLNDK